MTVNNEGPAAEKPKKVGKWEKFVMMKPLQWVVGIIGTVGLLTSGWRAVFDGNTTPVLIVSAVLLGVALIGDKIKEVNLATGELQVQLILARSALQDVALDVAEVKNDPAADAEAKETAERVQTRIDNWSRLMLDTIESEKPSGIASTWVSLNGGPSRRLKISSPGPSDDVVRDFLRRYLATEGLGSEGGTVESKPTPE
ncbi:hypothetical protein [Rhodococcus erythropolis]|uniref:hypothetical protein n=1 Tax=Rhodococcus erythropolis TaxID=1833 RepID=UPI001BE842D1|nr:hypothetical protein [Rhodococcus erythropolis]MBT2268768.1 hypothetical protein [Rhodococcus erythropolis]